MHFSVVGDPANFERDMHCLNEKCRNYNIFYRTKITATGLVITGYA